MFAQKMGTRAPGPEEVSLDVALHLIWSSTSSILSILSLSAYVDCLSYVCQSHIFVICWGWRWVLTQVIVNVEQLGNTDLHLISDFTLNEMSRFVSLKGKRVPSFRHYCHSLYGFPSFPKLGLLLGLRLKASPSTLISSEISLMRITRGTPPIIQCVLTELADPVIL